MFTRGSQREFFEVYPYILACPTHIRLARLIVLFFNQQTTLEWFVGVLVLFFLFFLPEVINPTASTPSIPTLKYYYFPTTTEPNEIKI